MNRYEMSDIAKAPFLNKERLRADIGDLMVLAPHPDDESLGCGGLIALMSKAGARVSVVFVTNGAASHTSKTHPPEQLIELRKKEAMEACCILGVQEKDIHFLGQRDSGLSRFNESELKTLGQQIGALFQEGRFKALAIPWRRDPHPDHVVVNQLGAIALQGLDVRSSEKEHRTKKEHPIIIEYPVWLWRHGELEDWPEESEVLPYRMDISEVYDTKWQAINCHRTQLGGVIDDDPNGFVLTPHMLAPFATNLEYFFVAPRNDLKTLDGAYFENLYSQSDDPWNFRNSAYEQDKYKEAQNALGSQHFEDGLELGCSIGIQTRLLASVCKHLIAVDISPIAIAEASEYCSDLGHVEFDVVDIVHEFPHGNYDLITCCELGYYLENRDLLQLFENMYQSLKVDGKLLMVHWTPFVPDYPLTGDAVHESFEEFIADKGYALQEIVHQRKELYRLQLWQKSREPESR